MKQEKYLDAAQIKFFFRVFFCTLQFHLCAYAVRFGVVRRLAELFSIAPHRTPFVVCASIKIALIQLAIEFI